MSTPQEPLSKTQTGWLDAAGVRHEESEEIPYDAWCEVLQLIGLEVLDLPLVGPSVWPSVRLRALYAQMPKLLTLVPGVPDPNRLLSEEGNETFGAGGRPSNLEEFVRHYGRNVGLLAAVAHVAFQFGNLHGRASSAAELQRLRSESNDLRELYLLRAFLRLRSIAFSSFLTKTEKRSG